MIQWDTKSALGEKLDDVMLLANRRYCEKNHIPEYSPRWEEMVDGQGAYYTIDKIKSDPVLYANDEDESISALARLVMVDGSFESAIRIGWLPLFNENSRTGAVKNAADVVKYGDTVYFRVLGARHNSERSPLAGLTETDTVPRLVKDLFGPTDGWRFVYYSMPYDGDDITDKIGARGLKDAYLDALNRGDTEPWKHKDQYMGDAENHRFDMFNKWREKHEVGGGSFVQPPRFADDEDVDALGSSDTWEDDSVAPNSSWERTVHGMPSREEIYGDEDVDTDYGRSDLSGEMRQMFTARARATMDLEPEDTRSPLARLADEGIERARRKADRDRKKAENDRRKALDAEEYNRRHAKLGSDFGAALKDYGRDLRDPVGARPYQEDDEIDEDNWLYRGNYEQDEYSPDEEAAYWYGDIER